jgi:ABC-type dipeptide/oligopeptide/nickel transport system permease subunit
LTERSTDPVLSATALGGIGGVPLPDDPGPSPDGGEVQSIQSGFRLALREFASNRLAIVGLAILVFFLLFCFLGPVVHPTNQTSTNPLITDMAPGGGHILGTDDNGFDEFGRIMKGGQAALEVGALSALIATVVGTLYGAIAGLVGGLVDGILMRFVDILLSIPYLILVLVLATKFSSWLVPARLIRGEVLTLRERDFVHAARVMGGTKTRLVYRHLIPNALSVVIVNVTFIIADSILALSFLGLLGFGLQYPAASWGDMLGNAQTEVSSGRWWLVYPVGFCLVGVVMACNFVGDALRDALDVRLRRR